MKSKIRKPIVALSTNDNFDARLTARPESVESYVVQEITDDFIVAKQSTGSKVDIMFDRVTGISLPPNGGYEIFVTPDRRHAGKYAGQYPGDEDRRMP